MNTKESPSKPTRLVIALVLVLSLFAAAMPAAAEPPGTVDVQLLAVNDFHGNLTPPTGSLGAGSLGGVAYLATHVNQIRATNPNTIFVSAGDLIGASPLISGLFHDEPTIEAFNLLGLDFSAVGNHEFDEGVAELKRMQEGGCHPTDGCQDGDPFYGAQFQYLAANVIRAANGKTLFPAYKIRSLAGAKVAFIGVSLEATPTVVTSSGVAGVSFLDEAETVNALVPEIKAKGIEAIVVVVHEGGAIIGAGATCADLSGPIVGLVNALDDEVDVVISGHTHAAYSCTVDNKLLTSASSSGRMITDVDLTIDRASGEVVSKQATNLNVTRNVPPDAAVSALLAKYEALVVPLANRVIGSITADITRSLNAAGESVLGDVIADAQLAATSPAGYGEAVVAFMNPGGIRGDLLYGQISGGESPGQATYGEAVAVQPFGNYLVTLSLTGAQIDTLLEQQFNYPLHTQYHILQVSHGFAYAWSATAPTGSKVDPASIMLNGVAVDPAAVYRVTVNNFLADGGDNFAVLTGGTDRLDGVVDVDALVAYFAANSPVPPGPQNRITMLP